MRSIAAVLTAVALAAGCDDVVGLTGQPTPLARVQVLVTGDLEPLRPPETQGETPHLRVALVWATQWLPEPFCFLPAASPEAAAVIAAGCRDIFGFAPERVGANVAVEPGVPATLELFQLPAADVMVGDVTARVAYASLVVYDDRDESGTLELMRPRPLVPEDGDEGDLPPPPRQDIVYGASFISMTQPDQRLAFREGAWVESAFYPRAGCEPPLPAFSSLSAGGFSPADAFAAALMGELPQEDPASCLTEPLAGTTFTIPLQPPEDVFEVRCRMRHASGIARYDEPPLEMPPLDTATWACAPVSSLGGEAPPLPAQLVFAVPPADAFSCMNLTHYVLRGCEHDGLCDPPEWDRTSNPPDWWPCSLEPVP